VRSRLVQIVVASVVIGLVAGGAYAIGAGSSGDTVLACAKRHGGALRLAKHCRSGERRVTWGKRGPRGRGGARGLPGSARAYAYVRAGATPFDAARSKGVVSITQPLTGYYCIRLAPSIDASKATATVTPVWSSGFADVPIFAQLVDKESVNTDAPCAGNGIVAWKGTLNGSSGGVHAVPGGSFDFTVVVP
jgi:hypothetical protein